MKRQDALEMLTLMQGVRIMENVNHSAFESGYNAAMRGCYRVLCCPKDDVEKQQWLAGYDSVPTSDRGKWPLTGPVPTATTAVRSSSG